MAFKIEEEIEILKYLLEHGEIDEYTYSFEVQRLFAKQEKLEAKGSHKKIIDSYTIVSVLAKALVVVSIFFIVASLMGGAVEDIEYQEVVSLRDIPEPVQRSCTGKVKKLVDDTVFDINYVASYVMQGRVVDIQKYVEYDIEEKLSPIDFGMAWGIMARDENVMKLRFSSIGNRFLHWNTSDREWLSKMGGWDKVGLYLSNNHLIPADEDIKTLLKKVKKDDYIEITGYLVTVKSEMDRYRFSWGTSTSRSDDGDGACELIYVTGVKWLKTQ